MYRSYWSLWFAAFVSFSPVGHARQWSIPLAGNSFRLSSEASVRDFRRDGLLVLKKPQDTLAAYFHADRPAELELKIQAHSSADDVVLRTRIGGKVFETKLRRESRWHSIGKVAIDRAGYVRVDLKIGEHGDRQEAEIRELIIDSDTDDLSLSFVRNNDGNMFYWGRRGPSVHLKYVIPRDIDLQYAYSEITVPVGQDALGSFFMANGFGEGYFGFQVNGATERRILFSVWSPFRTDNPNEIPPDQQIKILAKGNGVRVGEFGNEGSGGQSYLVYPWVAGTTYRFLTEVTPDGEGNTIYTSWFAEKNKPWRLIASFLRPQTDTHLRGFHAFLENFYPTTGSIERRGSYGNVWVRDVAGKWHECIDAVFSVDATGRKQHRLDFAGGADGEHFFLRNCGFFDQKGRPGARFKRQSSAEDRPQIDFENLPRQ